MRDGDRSGSDGDLLLTPGVRRMPGAYVFEALDARIGSTDPGRRDDLLENGFASERPRLRPAWLSDVIVVRSRAVPLRRSPLAAVVQSLGHNARGLIRWWLAVGACTASGHLLALPSITAIGLAAGLFFVAVLVHEAGHVLALRLLAGREAPAVLVSRGAQCHLVRTALDRPRECAVVASGPVAPLVVGVIVAPVLVTIAPGILAAWAAVAVGHAVSVLAPIGDGANLRLALRPAKPART